MGFTNLSCAIIFFPISEVLNKRKTGFLTHCKFINPFPLLTDQKRFYGVVSCEIKGNTILTVLNACRLMFILS